MFIKRIAAAAAGAGLLLAAACSSAQDGAASPASPAGPAAPAAPAVVAMQQAAAPDPVTVIETAPAEVETVTATVTAPAEVQTRTPDSCREAIDIARQGFSGAALTMDAFGQIMEGVVPALEAAASYDTAGIDAFTAVIEDANEDIIRAGGMLDADGFNAAAADCEAGR